MAVCDLLSQCPTPAQTQQVAVGPAAVNAVLGTAFQSDSVGRSGGGDSRRDLTRDRSYVH